MKVERSLRIEAGSVELEYPDVEFGGVVDFSDDWAMEVNRLSIFNVSEATVSELSGAESAKIEAGYRGREGVVTEGFVDDVEETRSDGDRVAEVFIRTGFEILQNTHFSRTWTSTVSGGSIIRAVVDEIDDLSVGRIVPGDGAEYPDRTLSTSAFDAILRTARDMGVRAYIRDLEVYAEPVDNESAPVVNVSQRNGLLAVNRSRSGRRGFETFKIESQLDPRIAEGVTVSSTDEELDGTYRVIEGSHLLNENRFRTEAKVIET